jgi:hypothetical protein
MTSITMNIAHLIDDDIYYMTISTFFLKWRLRRVGYGQHVNHQKKKGLNILEQGRYK